MIGKSLFNGELIELTALDAEKDAELVSSWTSDQEFVKRIFDGPFRQYPAFELKKKLKEKLKKAEEQRNAYFFAVRTKEKSEMVGLLRFGWIWGAQQSGRIFLDFENKAALEIYGEETLHIALRYAFMELSLYRLWVELTASNPDELTLYEKAGFLREVQRREASFHEGKYYDELGYALLKPEWKKMQEEVQNEK
jgi:RimJ/RimL family protein N-acetyltransferase